MVGAKARFRWMFRLLQIGLSVFFVIWVWRLIKTGMVWQTFANANPTLLATAIMIIPLGWAVRAWRHRLLIASFDRLDADRFGLWQSFKGFMLYLTGNATLPLRGGEWLRVAYIKTRCPKIPTAFLVGVAGAEKLPELLYAVIVVGLWVIFAPPDFVSFAVMIAVTFLALLGVVALLSREAATRGWVFIADWKQPGNTGATTILLDTLWHAAASLKAFGNVRDMASVAIATLTVRALDSVIMLLAASALEIPLSVEGSLLIGATLSLGLMISTLPAHIGVFEASVIAGGVLAGMNQEAALAFGLGFHAIVLISWSLAIGLSIPFLVRMVGHRGGVEI